MITLAGVSISAGISQGTEEAPSPSPSPSSSAGGGLAAVEVPERVGWRRGDPASALLTREWLITNGLGGYASGTLAGVPTRRYHGPLVAALPAPLGRTLMLNHLAETLLLGTESRADAPADASDGSPGGVVPLTALDPAPSDPSATPSPSLPNALALFRLVNGRPCWRFETGGCVLEKSVLMPHGQNTVLIRYRLLQAPGPVALTIEPLLDIRPHEGSVAGGPGEYRIEPDREGGEGGFMIVPPDAEYPPLRLKVEGGAAQITEGNGGATVRYRIEQARGYDSRGALRSAGALHIPIEPGGEVRFVASTEAWEQVCALPPLQAHALEEERRVRLLAQARPELRYGIGAELVLAADQFIIKPHTRPRDEAILNAQGDTACTIIAGYPWFTDWGRDTMISLEGLTLTTGRFAEARDIIHTFAHHVRDGLIPNLFPEGKSEGLYHTADATLWFFHAVDRYENATGDRETRRLLMPKLVEIVEKHIAGTRFGIGVDPADGLLRQGAPGYQLTWMDAKVGDWVVTPRRGKAVEINALFYNALCLLQRWLREAEADGWSGDAWGSSGGGPAGQRGPALRADEVAARAAELYASFNRRFWYAAGGYLYDVVDVEGESEGEGEGEEEGSNSGSQVRRPRDDASLRPNQLLAISLPHPVLDASHWDAVLKVVTERLVTPFGLRSLAPGHPHYKPRYDGDLRARDAAYHQGTVWSWLVGPFVDAWLKLHPEDPEGANRLLDGMEEQLGKSCIGSISEICDAEPPFAPRGCVAQAWSVAEALRVLSRIRARR